VLSIAAANASVAIPVIHAMVVSIANIFITEDKNYCTAYLSDNRGMNLAAAKARLGWQRINSN
jgi:hypothetical protein